MQPYPVAEESLGSINGEISMIFTKLFICFFVLRLIKSVTPNQKSFNFYICTVREINKILKSYKNHNIQTGL